VCLGSAGFTLLTLSMYRGAIDMDYTSVDPMRLVGGLIGGIGFLGAGAIIQSRGDVQGITTAASIWLTGAVGIASGLGEYVLAGMLVALAYLLLSVFVLVERWLKKKTDKE